MIKISICSRCGHRSVKPVISILSPFIYTSAWICKCGSLRVESNLHSATKGFVRLMKPGARFFVACSEDKNGMIDVTFTDMN